AMSLPETFQTTRLEAERLAAHHLADLIEFHRDPGVMAELGGVRDEEQTSRYLSRNLEHWAEHGFGVWMLRERGGGSGCIGRAILRYLPLDGVNELEIGFALYPRFWGRGLATEVAEACTAFAWRDLDAPSLIGVTTPANHASRRVLCKIGLHFEREIEMEETRCLLYRAASPLFQVASG
ncbi:MAG: GNAT family N-acetyltransferase, partial [Myxococcota bacterium]